MKKRKYFRELTRHELHTLAVLCGAATFLTMLAAILSTYIPHEASTITSSNEGQKVWVMELP